MKAYDLEKEAQLLLQSNRFEEALIKYKELGEIPFGAEWSIEGIRETKLAAQELTKKMNYLDKIEVSQFVARRMDTYTEKDVPAVRFKIKNNGDQSLSMVKLIVYFHDKSGKAIYEEDFYPVSNNSYENRKPLKPGYVREMQKGTYYTIESALTDWEVGSATIKVVDLRFEPNL
jgi:hypothetical protein